MSSTKPSSVNIDPQYKNFKNFLALIWKCHKLPSPTPLQYNIAEFLQSDNRYICVIAFRGIGKSWISAAYACFCLYHNPDAKILVVSASQRRAVGFCKQCKDLIAFVPLLKELRTRSGQRDSSLSFDVGLVEIAGQSPSMSAFGITGQITGQRADIIIADDVEASSNSMTQHMRSDLKQRTLELHALLHPNKQSKIIFLGTPQTEMSIYNELPKEGFLTKIWTAEYPPISSLDVYGNKLAPLIRESKNYEEGEPTDTRFSKDELQIRKLGMGNRAYQLQFMLDTTLNDSILYPLKVNDLVILPGIRTWDQLPARIRWSSNAETKQMCKSIQELSVAFDYDYYVGALEVSKEVVGWENTILSIDPAGQGFNRTAFCVLRALHGNIFLIKAGSLEGGFKEENLIQLTMLAKQYKANAIVLEKNFGDGAFGELLKGIVTKIYPTSIQQIRHTSKQGTKQERIINSLEVIMNNHRLIVDEKVIIEDAHPNLPLEHKLIYQMTRMSAINLMACKYDDAIDCLAMGCQYLEDTLKLDQDLRTQEVCDRIRWNNLVEKVAKLVPTTGNNSQFRHLKNLQYPKDKINVKDKFNSFYNR